MKINNQNNNNKKSYQSKNTSSQHSNVICISSYKKFVDPYKKEKEELLAEAERLTW